MAGSLNRVMLLGHVGRDPEVRSTQAGNKLANVSLATSDTWKDKATGERKERTDWHRVSIYNQHIVDVVEKYVTKGSKLYIEGSLQSRKFTDKDGADRTITEIVIGPYNGQLMLLESKLNPKPGLDDDIPF